MICLARISRIYRFQSYLSVNAFPRYPGNPLWNPTDTMYTRGTYVNSGKVFGYCYLKIITFTQGGYDVLRHVSYIKL